MSVTSSQADQLLKENPWTQNLKKLPWGTIVPIITLLLVFVSFSLMNEAFLDERNLTNLSRQVTVNCILAFGMTHHYFTGRALISVSALFWHWGQSWLAL